VGAHAKLSPSDASIWSRCPGSIEAREDVPDDGGRPAAEGTAAHAIFEECLTLGLEPHDFVGQKRRIVQKDRKGAVIGDYTIEITEEMAEYLAPVIDDVLDLGGDQFYEQKVSTETWCGPDQFGTLDVGVYIEKSRRLIIGDLKYGFVGVSPIENEQEILYAGGFWEQYERDYQRKHKFKPQQPKSVTLIIFQPRASSGGGEWTISWEELQERLAKLKKAAARVKPGAPRIAGKDQCTWCRAAEPPADSGIPRCQECLAFRLSVMQMKFSDLDADKKKSPTLPAVETLTPERRSYLIEHADFIKKWFGTLHSAALHDALGGRPTPGLKAVLGKRPARKWANERRIERKLRDEFGYNDETLFTRKIVSPAAVEKVVGGKKKFKIAFDGLVDEGVAKPVLVPEEDGRDAIKSYTEKFEDLSEEDEFSG
jgi:hypothetical protein